MMADGATNAGGKSVELLHAILDSLTRQDSLPQPLRFFVEQAPFVTAITVMVFAVFTLLEVVAFRRHITASGHSRRHGFIGRIRPYVMMFGIFAATLLGLYEIETNWIRKPQEIVWRDQVDLTLQTCLDKLAALPAAKRDEIQQRLLKNYESPRLQCLAYAVQSAHANERMISPDAPAADFFRVDMRRANALLTVPYVSDILSEAFSIESTRYLGYGYSLPVKTTQYSDAVIHEYLIRNRCATASTNQKSPCFDKNNLPQQRQLFTWIMPAGAITSDPNETIGKLLAQAEPVSGAQSFASSLADLQNGRLKKTPPVLIRFGRFPSSAYLGTIGRQQSTYVFFSNLGEVWNKTIYEAEAASGRVIRERDKGDPSLSMFIWLYYPSGEDDARPATWGNVIELLHEVPVAPEIARLVQ